MMKPTTVSARNNATRAICRGCTARPEWMWVDSPPSQGARQGVRLGSDAGRVGADAGRDVLAVRAPESSGNLLATTAESRSVPDVLDNVRANASYCPYQMSSGGERGRRLDRASFVPLSQQLYPRLRQRILSGRDGEGATLETESASSWSDGVTGGWDE